ncbi:MAG: hypothetical protein SGARI_007251, partial [Bacillariaceae sp.]
EGVTKIIQLVGKGTMAQSVVSAQKDTLELHVNMNIKNVAMKSTTAYTDQRAWLRTIRRSVNGRATAKHLPLHREVAKIARQPFVRMRVPCLVPTIQLKWHIVQTMGSVSLYKRMGKRCPPGYTGAHCELYDRVRPSPQSNKNTEMAAILIVGFVIGVLLVFLVLVSVLRWRAMKQRKQKHVTETITAAHMQELSSRQSAVMEEMDFDPDFDEGELEEVELL